MTFIRRCFTCRHWTIPSESEHAGREVCEPTDPDTLTPMRMPFEVRRCRNPKLLFCERPVEDPGFAVADGSTYFAGLYTTAKFGCVLHET